MENNKIQALVMGNVSKNLNAFTFLTRFFELVFFDSSFCKVKN